MTLPLGLRQFIHLRRHDMSCYAVAVQPVPGAAIAVEAGMPAVDEHEHAAKTRIIEPRAKIRGGQRVKLFARLVATARIAKPGEVHQEERWPRLYADPIEVGQPR